MSARILVVDDEPDLKTLVLQKFRQQIRDGTVDFLFAHDGVEALAALKANGGIDLVVTDINMPRMDGLALLQKLQESEENVSTIVVSAYGDMGNIRTAMNRGAFDFVTKPIDFRDLETTIAKTIRHIEYLREARRRQAEAERAYMSLSRYFSPNLAQRLARDADAVDLCGQRRQIATLFTDITGFTALVETLEPSVLGPLLNEYFAGMTDIVFAHDGTVAKIVGDALHVLFEPPVNNPTMPTARSRAHWRWTTMPSRCANAATKRVSRSVSPGLASMPDRRWWGISVVSASSITPPMAIQLMLVRGSKRPTSTLGLASVSVQRWQRR
jgi:adenylate cyclase